MTITDKKLETIEKELREYGLLKQPLSNLDGLHNQINGRIIALQKLKEEIRDISKELYYYDLVTYISNVPVKSLTLRDCAAILKDLTVAEAKFNEHSSREYLAISKDLRTKILKIGTEISRDSLKNGSMGVEIWQFYKECNEAAQNRLQQDYLKYKYAGIQSKIKECVADMRKNWRMLLLGEIQGFSQCFDERLLEKYSKEGFPLDAKQYSLFEAYLFRVASEILRRVPFKIAEEIYAETNQNRNTSDATAAVLNSILFSFFRAYFGTKMSLQSQ